MHDYVPFYFGFLSPMLFQLKTNRVPDYTEGQEPLIYLVSTAQDVAANHDFVFSNGHGIAAYTEWFSDLGKLNEVDWNMVYQRYWLDSIQDMDRQRRKQAEFLVHRACSWALVHEVGVVNDKMKAQVEGIIAGFSAALYRPVHIRRNWYYY